MPSDLSTLIDFLNEIIGARGQRQDKYKLFKMSLYDSFEIRILYDNNWSFLLMSEGVCVEIDFQQGMKMLQRLNSWNKQLQEHEAKDHHRKYYMIHPEHWGRLRRVGRYIVLLGPDTFTDRHYFKVKKYS